MDTSAEYIKVIIVHFSFSFVYAKYLHIASYLYGKQIKSNLGTKLYLCCIYPFAVAEGWLLLDIG